MRCRRIPTWGTKLMESVGKVLNMVLLSWLLVVLMVV